MTKERIPSRKESPEGDLGVLDDLLDALRDAIEALDAHRGGHGKQQGGQAHRVDHAGAVLVKLLPSFDKLLRYYGGHSVITDKIGS